jgi:hypothetical protein
VREERFSIRGRVIFIGIAVATVLELHLADPVIVSRWLPFRASCGAITGLPCLFCGMTRALHLLLRGDFSGALYFNWLAFPFLAGCSFLVALFVLEIVHRRRILNLRKIMPLTIRQLTICAITAVALWTLQAYLAVSQHKTELLNPHGPLYHVFVKD